MLLKLLQFNAVCLIPHADPLGSAPLTPSQEFASGFSDTEGARVRDTAGYMARRDLFTSGLEMERSEQISRKEAMRESAERISLNKRVSEGLFSGDTGDKRLLLQHG